MTKFDEHFNEVSEGFDGELFLSAEKYSEEEAKNLFDKYISEMWDKRQPRYSNYSIQLTHMRYCVQYYDGEKKPAWWSCEPKKGAKKVWVAQ